MQKSEELSFRDVVAIIRRRWWVIVAVAALFGALAYTRAKAQTPTYESTSVLLLDPRTTNRIIVAAGGTQDNSNVERILANEVEFARGAVLRDEVAARTAVDGVELSVDNPDADIIEFTAQEPSAAQAQLVAQTAAVVYQELSAQRAATAYTNALASIDSVLAPIRARLVELSPLTSPSLIDPKVPGDPDLLAERKRLETELQTNEARRTAIVLASQVDRGVQSNIVTPAPLPRAAASPSPVRDALIALAVGLVLSLGVLLLVDYLDDRLRDRQAISRVAPGIATLATVPRSWRAARGRGSLAAAGGPVGESIRSLRTAIQFAGLSRPLRSILVTSSKPKEGKSTVAVSTALAMAGNGTPTVLVDADLRRPRAHKILGVADNSVGLSSVLEGRVPLREALRGVPGVDNLALLTSGPQVASPADLLWSSGAGRRTIKHVVDELVASGYTVIVDAPPVLPVSDALTVSRAVDGVVFVVSMGQAHERDLSRAFELLAQSGAFLVGLAVNKVHRAGGSYSRAYSYGSGRSRSSAARTDRAAQAAATRSDVDLTGAQLREEQLQAAIGAHLRIGGQANGHSAVSQQADQPQD